MKWQSLNLSIANGVEVFGVLQPHDAQFRKRRRPQQKDRRVDAHSIRQLLEGERSGLNRRQHAVDGLGGQQPATIGVPEQRMIDQPSVVDRSRLRTYKDERARKDFRPLIPRS